MKKLIAIAIALSCSWLLTQPVKAETEERVKRIGQSLFELQQDYLLFKEDYRDQKDKWRAQQEEFNLLVEKLRAENRKLTEQARALQEKVESFEAQLETSEQIKLSRDIQVLDQLLRSILLVQIDEDPEAEELILEIINDAEADIPKDLLVLYLAQNREQQEEWQDSLGYYSTLVAEFPESPYVYRAIYAMSELFGRLGKTTEQKTLLNQLSYLEAENPYARKARQKLAAMEDAAGEEDSPADGFGSGEPESEPARAGVDATNDIEGGSKAPPQP